jgi:hypothetical protein
MSIYRVQVTLQGKTGLAKDRFVNNFAMSKVGATDAQIATAAALFPNFYKNGPSGGGAALSSKLSPEIATAGHTVKVYDLADPTPRVPRATVSWAFAAALGGTALPSEVAMCLSFQAAPVSGQKQARRRGRVYLGPLNTTAMVVGTLSEARPGGTFQDETMRAYLDLAAALNTAAGWDLVVFSPTNTAESPGLIAAIIDQVSTDNAFDTQRRRGVAPSARSFYPVP